MRIDMFLDAVNLTKKRSIAQDMIAHGAILLNGSTIKPSREVKAGDKLAMIYLKSDGSKVVKNYQILSVPTQRNNPKTKQEDFIKELI